MNLLRLILTASFFLFFGIAASTAQDKSAAQSEATGSGMQKRSVETATPEKQLSASVVSKFIRTYKPLIADLEAFSEKYSEKEILTAPQAMATSEEAQAILKKHGWDENYFLPFSVIAMGYSVVKLEKEFESLPKAQRDQMKAYNLTGNLSSTIHPDDLKLVKANFTAIDKVMQD